MTRSCTVLSRCLLGIALMVSALPASAQSIGTFSWQLQPYCNRLVVEVVATPSGFTLAGLDDQCGNGPSGRVTGTAQVDGGNVAIKFQSVVPGVKDVHVVGTISLGTYSGTWSDNGGLTGTLVFGGPGGGAAVPTPALPQRRVSGTCVAGSSIRAIAADGTVTCDTPAPAALQCTNTSIHTFTVSANTVSFFNNPACPAGYDAVTPYCWTASAGVYSQGSGYNANVPGNATFCAWQNTTGSEKSVFGGNMCCRVPGA